MASRRVHIPRPVARVVDAHADDQAGTERMLDQLTQAAERNRTAPRTQMTVDLVVGVNRIAHRLGRRAMGANVTPTVADATFAWSFAPDGDKFAIITVVGVDQPAAPLEVW